MRLLYVFILMFMLVSASQLFAANEVTVISVDGVTDGKAEIGNTVTFRFHWQNDWPNPIWNFLHQYRLYSTDGASWTDLDCDFVPDWEVNTDFGSSDAVTIVNGDGLLEDTITIQALLHFLPPGHGLHGAAPTTSTDCWTITLSIPADPTLHGRTICLDQFGAIWVDSVDLGGLVIPDWSGEICFTIDGSACCHGRTGNINQIGTFPEDVDSSDLGALVTYLFCPPGQTCFQPPCPVEADVDASQGEVPIDSSDLGALVAFLFADPPGSVTLPDCP